MLWKLTREKGTLRAQSTDREWQGNNGSPITYRVSFKEFWPSQSCSKYITARAETFGNDWKSIGSCKILHQKKNSSSPYKRGQILPKCRIQIIHNWSVVVINQSKRMSYVLARQTLFVLIVLQHCSVHSVPNTRTQKKSKRCECRVFKTLYEGLNLSRWKLWHDFLLYYSIANAPSSSLKVFCSC